MCLSKAHSTRFSSRFSHGRDEIMYGYFPFEVPSRSGPRRRTLILFCSVCGPEELQMAETMEEYCNERVPPDDILILAPISEKNAISAAVSGEVFMARCRSVTRYHDTPRIQTVFFNETG